MGEELRQSLSIAIKLTLFYYFHFKMYFLKIVDIGAYLLQKFGSTQ